MHGKYRSRCSNLTNKISASIFYKEPTFLEKYRQHVWRYTTIILVGITVFLFGWAKTASYIAYKVNREVIEKDHAIEQISLENTRLVELQNSSPSDVIKVAEVIQDILNTADGDQRKFLEKILPFAIRFQRQKGIPVSGMVAQSIYESGYGQSDLAKQGYNYFGLKSLGVDVPTIYMMTTDLGVKHIQPFRKFDNPYDGFLGYVNFLTSPEKNGRYLSAFREKTGVGFIKELLRDGYCPNPNYLNDITKIIKRHKLDRLEDILN